MRDLQGGGYLLFAESARMKPLWRLNDRNEVNAAQRMFAPYGQKPAGETRTCRNFTVQGRGGTLVVNSDGKVVATDGACAFTWNPKDGSLESAVPFKPTPDAVSVEAFSLSPDGQTCMFGSEGGCETHYEAFTYSCTSGAPLNQMQVYGPSYTAMIVHYAFSVSGQYIATLNSSSRVSGFLDPRIAIYRGKRFFTVRKTERVRFLSRCLLLVRAERASLRPSTAAAGTIASWSGSYGGGGHDRLSVLAKLASSDVEPALIGAILGEIGSAWV